MLAFNGSIKWLPVTRTLSYRIELLLDNTMCRLEGSANQVRRDKSTRHNVAIFTEIKFGHLIHSNPKNFIQNLI